MRHIFVSIADYRNTLRPFVRDMTGLDKEFPYCASVQIDVTADGCKVTGHALPCTEDPRDVQRAIRMLEAYALLQAIAPYFGRRPTMITLAEYKKPYISKVPGPGSNKHLLEALGSILENDHIRSIKDNVLFYNEHYCMNPTLQDGVDKYILSADGLEEV